MLKPWLFVFYLIGFVAFGGLSSAQNAPPVSGTTDEPSQDSTGDTDVTSITTTTTTAQPPGPGPTVTNSTTDPTTNPPTNPTTLQPTTTTPEPMTAAPPSENDTTNGTEVKLTGIKGFLQKKKPLYAVGFLLGLNAILIGLISIILVCCKCLFAA